LRVDPDFHVIAPELDRGDCFVAPLLAMTAAWVVIASEAKQSRSG
jgi:hypothetical protein